MSNNKIPDLGPKIPIIQAHKDQRLIIDFIRNEEGADVVTISFEPDFDKVERPAQAAAMHVANTIIDLFGLNREGEQNATTTETEQ